MSHHNNNAPLRLVVLISGNGSNLQAILDARANGGLPARVCAVISDRATAHGLERARHARVTTEVCRPRAGEDRATYDQALMTRIDAYAPELVVLAGFMRIFTPDLVHHYHGRMVNIHPSLLPHYRGLNTHQRVLEAGELEHGCTVHFVTPELDGGPIIAQARVAVRPGDDAQRLAARVQASEHRLYPQVIDWFARGRLRLQGERVLLDESPPLAQGMPRP